jgi:hypothetical protein
MGGSQVMPVDTNGHRIQFNTEISDPYNLYNVGTYEYIAAVRGDVEVAAYLQVDNQTAVGSLTEFAFRAMVNGAPVLAQGTSVGSPPGARWYPPLAGMVTLVPGDVLTFELSANDGTNTGTVLVSNGAVSIRRI